MNDIQDLSQNAFEAEDAEIDDPELMNGKKHLC